MMCQGDQEDNQVLLGIIIAKMSRQHILDNYQSFSGISNIGGNHESLMHEAESKQEIFYTIKVNAPNDGTSSIIGTAHLREEESEKGRGSVTQKNPFTADTTGYDINRDLYSEEEIREAFKVIDINKDGVLTTDDLSFFLRCMGQDFCPEEVQEMIALVSADHKGVQLDDFKKIGKGKLIPYAGIRIPESNAQLKQTVLSNVLSSGLLDLEPQTLLLAQENGTVSHSKFELERGRRFQEAEAEIEEEKEEEGPLLRVRTHQQIVQRRSQAARLPMLNLERIIENLEQVKGEYLESRDIAALLTIDQPHARRLFTDPYRRVRPRQAILEAILLSSKPPQDRLDLLVEHYGRGGNLNLEQWVQILAFMLGSDQKQTARRRLSRILTRNNSKLDAFFEKSYIHKVMRQELSAFNW